MRARAALRLSACRCIIIVTALPVSGEHLPCRADSLYLHPETMQAAAAGLTIGQPVLLQRVGGGGVSEGRSRAEEGSLAAHEESCLLQSVAVGKCWPVSKLDIDGVCLK